MSSHSNHKRRNEDDKSRVSVFALERRLISIGMDRTECMEKHIFAEANGMFE